MEIIVFKLFIHIYYKFFVLYYKGMMLPATRINEISHLKSNHMVVSFSNLGTNPDRELKKHVNTLFT